MASFFLGRNLADNNTVIGIGGTITNQAADSWTVPGGFRVTATSACTGNSPTFIEMRAGNGTSINAYITKNQATKDTGSGGNLTQPVVMMAGTVISLDVSDSICGFIEDDI